ncbi:histone-lysine N-methyltransferase SUVR5 [Trifolium repens]|nr:histone-lysine N-methyltransferase SUVR5 [Trifolium repens]
MEKLICMENSEYDIMKLDAESSDDSLLVMQVPAQVENQVQLLENGDDNGLVENQVQEENEDVNDNDNGQVENEDVNVNGQVENQLQEENENVNGLAIQIFEEPGTKDSSTSTTNRQCRAYIEAKGRQCARTAIRNDIYCCAHFSNKKGKRVEVHTPMCGGITVSGTRCKHRSLRGHAFCKKHLRNVKKGQTSNSKRRTRKRKFEENCTDMVLAHQEIPLEINPVSVINKDDSFAARNIIGETLTLSSTDRNEVKAVQWIGSPHRGNDREDSCFDNENGFKCKICFEEFSNDQTLGNHWMENHEKEAKWLFRSYACAICLDSFKNKKLMETHVHERHRVQFFEHSVLLICIPCGRHFENMDELWLHVMSSHPAELRLLKAPEQLTLSIGDDSLKMIEYGNEASLNNNSKTPSDLQKLVCKFCGLKFDLLSDLNRHRQAVHMEHNVPSWVEASNRLGRRARSNLNRSRRANNSLDILSSTVWAECCQDNLEALLKAKYGYLPERLYLKAPKLCGDLASESNI